MFAAKWLNIVSLLSGFLFVSCEKMSGWLDAQMEKDFYIARYDRLQNELGVTGNFTTMQRMYTEFPRQTQILIEDVLEIGSVTDEDIKDKLGDCLSDTAMLLLMADGERRFGDMRQLNGQFEKAIGRLKKDLPQLPPPHVYAQFSGLNQSVVVSDSLVGFSIDKYMGVDYPLYKKYFYDNQIATMTPERIVTDCLYYYLRSNFPLPSKATGTLLENMVLTGKLNWVTLRLTGDNSVEQLLGYSATELQWIRANRQSILDYVTKRANSTDPQVLRGLLNPMANAIIDGKKAPALLGIWTGYQMVVQFMKSHKQLSVGELLSDDNLMEIALAFNPNL